MTKPLGLASLLLFTSALATPAIARAQSAPSTPEPAAQDQAPAPALPQDQAAPQEQAPDVSVPGGEIVVVGRHNNISRETPQVVSVLSTADIARTGEGDIAGALSRVTGLSVVGNGYVYVRGLGDRYSLALLNGSPLPSPEPLKRVVPLDIFPTNVISSSLVQKSYSPNFPGEFGGGVVNLTTNSIPRDGFLTVGGGIGANLRTTGNLGYVHAGGSGDWTGYDDGSRDIPPALAAFFANGDRLGTGTVDEQEIAGQLVNAKIGLVQRQKSIGPNWTATISGGKSWDIGDVNLGVIATGGFSSKWQTRDSIQQTSSTSDLSQFESDFTSVATDNRVVVNGLLGFGLEFGDNKIRWTNLYIHDTLKHTRLAVGHRHNNDTSNFMDQDTAWYERQLIDTQLVAELKLNDKFSLDLRGSYANTKRKAPGELSIEYVQADPNAPEDSVNHYYANLLNGNNGNASIAYSDLNEDLWSGGADLTYRAFNDLSVTVGYAYSNTNRFSSRRDFEIDAQGRNLPPGVSMLRPDLLLGSAIIDYYNLGLTELYPEAPAFTAKLINHAGYGRINWQVTPELSLDAGVRYETAKQSVRAVEIFNTPVSPPPATRLDNDYWLPAATLTWQLDPEMQVRFNASETIARPQFRELIYQFYYDPETNRTYRGNPLLRDTKLYNAEARFEWYFAGQQHVSIAGFYKRLDNPIESFIQDETFTTSFANAPKADLYGGEVELLKKFALGASGFFGSRDLVTIANYTYTKSKLKVGPNDTTEIVGAPGERASNYFRDGAPLTGQSDHLANLQLGFEDRDHLSQQTLILSYASKRVTSRGLRTTGQPDIYEYPGFTLDFVARQGVKVVGHQFDIKFEARNITDRTYKETQSNGTNTIIFNRYKPGPILNLSLSTTF